MAFYTVLIPPPGAGGPREEVERARLLPDGFSWPAFALTGLWLLSKRLWLWTAVFALLWGALFYLRTRLGLPAGYALIAQAAIGLFLGLEGHNLVARKLQRGGWRLADVVEARDLAEAERRYFERALEPGFGARPAALASRPPASAGPVPIIGLFPEARGR